MVSSPKSLSIIIPAFNEENAIEQTIRRARDCIPKIKKDLSLEFVEVIVVNDGSKDKTKERAQNEKGIVLITYPDNRGYGKAIKMGFEYASGEIVGFLDADGTCNPEFLIELCKPIINGESDIVLGNRLTQTSKMPLLRKLGNIIYASMLQFLARKVVRDTASGMRVIRKSILPLLYPLPDGMHFTPAMSAKALFDPEIRIKEVSMHYEERIGQSKLHVVKDGLRFFKIILQTAFAYRPRFIYNIFSIFCIIIGLAYSAQPLMYYFQHSRIEDYMYYRLSAITILFIVAALTFNIGIINHRITILRNRKSQTPDSFFAKYNGIWGVALILGAIILTHQGIYSYVLTGKVYLHWVYILTGEFLSVLGLIFIFSKIIYSTVNFIKMINMEQPCDHRNNMFFEEKYKCSAITTDNE